MKKVFLLVILVSEYFYLSAQSENAGREHYYYQRYSSAEAFFHNAIKQEPGSADAWLWLIKSYVISSQTKNAIDTLHWAPVTIHEEPHYLVAKGTVLLAANKTDSAGIYFTRAIDITKGKNAEILGLVADAHIGAANGDMNYAIEQINKALKRDKNSALLYTKLGNAYLKMHNATEAYKAYSAAIEKDRNHAEAYYQLGYIFLTQKNTELYVDFFNKAINADKNYAPAYFELYEHYLYKDPAKAKEFFDRYTALSDKSLKQEYAYTDLLYLTKDYQNAITHAKALITRENPQPRIFKLVAYSYTELKDSAMALSYMKQYFDTHADSLFIAKDYETMAELYDALNQNDSTMTYYDKAIGATKDSSRLYYYYEKLALLAKAKQDYAAQAKWLGRFYTGNAKASNVDLFNWGIAAYRAADYLQSDTVFKIYKEKYPEQKFGYYWLARSNAAIDTAMTEGRAVPHYQKLIEVIGTDSLASLTATDKKWLTESYSYLAAYETNTEKDYKEAIDYFSRVLEIDPANDNAKKYITILEDNLKKEESRADGPEKTGGTNK